MSGYIKLHRSLLDHHLMTNQSYFLVFIQILLRCNHKDTNIIINGKKTLIKRGSFYTSFTKLSEQIGVNRSTIQRAINYLKSDTMIDTIKIGKGTLISCVNYEKYQSNRYDSDTIEIRKRYDSDTIERTNNNDKNDNNIKKKDINKLISKKESDKNEQCNIFESIDKKKKFIKPEINEIFKEMSKYAFSKCLDIHEKALFSQSEQFFNYYESNGWKVAGKPMKSWIAASRNWLLRYSENNYNKIVNRKNNEQYETESVNEIYEFVNELKKRG